MDDGSDPEPTGMRRVRRRILTAFVILGCLALFGTAAVVHRIAFAIPASTAVARQADEVVLRASQVSRHVNAITATMAAHQRGPADALVVLDIADRMVDIETAVAMAPALVVPADRGLVERLEVRLQYFQAEAGRLLALMNSPSQVAEVNRRAAALWPSLAEMRPLFDELIQRNQERSHDALQDSNAQMRMFLWMTAVATGLFLVTLVGAGYYTLRILTQQQQQIARQLRQLELVNRDLSAFAGRIAHDLRAPLSPIVLATGQLALLGDPRVDVFARRITRSAQRANELIDQLLAFSRAGQPGSDEVSASAEAVERVLEACTDAAATARIDLSAEVDHFRVRASATLVCQILQNLVDNAIRYMPAEATPRTIRVRAHAADGFGTFEVVDTGPGIPPAQRERVFEPFQRLDDSRHLAGTGLGLATARRMVEAHGGRIGIDDGASASHGCRVWFTLPLAPEQHEDPPTARRSGGEATAQTAAAA